MRELILIRHGLTEGNEKHWYYGGTDLPLSAAGKEQLLARKREGVYPDTAGKRLITTPYRRTRETLALLYPGAEAEELPELREVNFGEFECKSYDDLKDNAAYQAWLAGDWYNTAPPGGESFGAAEVRLTAALQKLLAREEDALLVVHGGTILVFMELLFPEAHKTQYEWQPAPGGGWAVNLAEHTFRPI